MDSQSTRSIGSSKVIYTRQVVVHGEVEEDEDFIYITTDRGTTRISKDSVVSVEPAEIYRNR